MNKTLFLLAFIALPSLTHAQQSSLKQPMFKDLQVTNSITKSYGDSTCVFHVAAIDEGVTPETSKRYFWYHQGEIKSTQGNYTGKLLHGSYEKFDRDGTLLEKGAFENGVKDGQWLSWYHNGNLMRHLNWNNGQRAGHFDVYDQQGNKSVTGGYKRGMLHGTVRYFENGVETRDEKYRNGKLVKAKEKEKRFWKFGKSGKDSTQAKPAKEKRKRTPKASSGGAVDTSQPSQDPPIIITDPSQQPATVEEKKSKQRKKKKQPTEDSTVNK